MNKLHDRILTAINSEHCSYKSSKRYLEGLYTKGVQVIQGPGENAGIVDIGNNYAITLRIESHNHPTQVSPREGAATGVGGILRDIFTMGSRPIALLDFLHFGTNDHSYDLLKKAVEGIGYYGNTIGVPVVGGYTVFDSSYTNNCLVNVCSVGLVRHNNIIYGNALSPAQDIIYVGAKTGMDGIGGSEMASESLSSNMNASSIQKSDPYLEKLLLEACCELAETEWIEGMQDMGAAGLLCATSEVIHRGRKKTGHPLGIDLYIDKVPTKCIMTPEDILLSESQERMLIVGKTEHREDILDLFKQWDLEAVVIGKTTLLDTYNVIVNGYDECVLDFDELFPDIEQKWPPNEIEKGPSFSGDFPDDVVRSIWRSYDWMVGTRTIKGPNEKGRYAILDIPEVNGELVILWSKPASPLPVEFDKMLGLCDVLNIEPLGITNCLNFGHPADCMLDFKNAVEDMNTLCRWNKVPIVSGNVSLYNSTDGVSITPTPVIVMVGMRYK